MTQQDLIPAPMSAARAIYEMPAEHYHAIPAANASSLKVLAEPDGTISDMLKPYEAKPAFDLGTAIHSLVLEGREAFRERHPIRPKTWDSWRTKAAKEWRAERIAEGCVVLEPAQATLVARIGKELRKNWAAMALLEASIGHREVTMLWDDEDHNLPCKCRFDALALDGGDWIGVDLKSTRSAKRRRFTRDAFKLGYHLQFAHYAAGFQAATGKRLLSYAIIAVETAEPYGVATFPVHPDTLERGEAARQRALEEYAEWHHAGRLEPETVYSPGFQTPIEPPSWA